AIPILGGLDESRIDPEDCRKEREDHEREPDVDEDRDHDAGAPQPDGFEDPVRERAETDAIEDHPDVSVATDPGEHGVHLDDKARSEEHHEERDEEDAVSFATAAGGIGGNRER